MVISEEELSRLIQKIELVDEQTQKEIQKYRETTGASLEDTLLQKNIVTDEQLGIMISNHLNIPFVSLSKISIQPEVVHIVPERVARRHHVIAFAKENDTVKLAMANPKNQKIIDLIAKKSNSKIEPHLATERDIGSAFYVYKRNLQEAFDTIVHRTGDDIRVFMRTAPVAEILDLILETAYYDKASDVHIEPFEEYSLVRYRIDGILQDMLKYPKALHERIMTRLKVQARLRTDEHMAPQDGKIRFDMPEAYVDLRLSILPLVEGEKAVLRLLASHDKTITLSDLGMNKKDLETVERSYNKPHGMILSTGPTGSGKSTSIYAILKVLNTREKNITTIEDPVEYRLQGVNQIQVNPKANLTFASGLRSILRQDPNVILVGEIRDSETAGIAVNAALTGHLVVSTLHTNDAPTALPRLIDMKIEPFLVSSTVNVIIAQRLVRKICDMCKTSQDLPREDLENNFEVEIIKKYFGTKKTIRVFEGKGCKVCNNTGYLGRLGVFEVLEVSEEIRKLIIQKANSDIIRVQAQKEGMTTMLEDGLMKAKEGVTSIAEVLRVTKTES